MARYNPRRSQQEWLQLITECRQSGMADNAWCERHNIPLSSFYNAVTRLRKKACAIPDSAAQSDNLYTLDFTSHQDVVRIGIDPAPVPEEAGAHMTAADPDTAHTIELMMGDIRIKISNSVNPGLLTMIFQMLKAQSCQPTSLVWTRLYRLRQN